jgi:hypothetical protein
LGWTTAHHGNFEYSEDDNNVVESAVSALEWIVRSAERPQAVVEAGTLVLLDDLLQSSTSEVRMWTCEMLGNLVYHEPTAAAFPDANPCARLVSSLR